MAVKTYGSVNGVSKKIKKLYGSVNGVSRKIKKLYGSVNGVSRLIYSAEPTLTISTAAASTTGDAFSGTVDSGGYGSVKQISASNGRTLYVGQHFTIDTNGAFVWTTSGTLQYAVRMYFMQGASATHTIEFNSGGSGSGISFNFDPYTAGTYNP